MKEHFFNYYPPTTEEISQLWENGLIIFDTNVLNKLYCYTDNARTDFLKALEHKAEHLWLPNQVAFEYQKNRLGKIDEQIRAYDAIKELLDNHLQFDKLSNPLENYKYHPYINKDEILAKISKIKKEIESIKKNLDETKEKHPNLISDDIIRSKITELFHGRIGEPCSNSELETIYKEGESRYKENIPPGYKDNAKKGTSVRGNKLIIDKYGDLIIWFQIIEKAKKDKKPVIFITDDSKEDWWWIFKGQKIGPHPELILEFKTKTGMPYYMYSADRFLEYLKTNIGIDIRVETISEVRNINLFSEKNKIDVESLANFLHEQFPNRFHAELDHVYKLSSELSEEDINSIDDLNILLSLYPMKQHIFQFEQENNGKLSDVAVIRTLLVANKINEINKIIQGWGPLPAEPRILRDETPFIGAKMGVPSYLLKNGQTVKIEAANVGELDISYSELGNRIGTGLPYLRRLISRLEPFHDLLLKYYKS